MEPNAQDFYLDRRNVLLIQIGKYGHPMFSNELGKDIMYVRDVQRVTITETEHDDESIQEITY